MWLTVRSWGAAHPTHADATDESARMTTHVWGDWFAKGAPLARGRRPRQQRTRRSTRLSTPPCLAIDVKTWLCLRSIVCQLACARTPICHRSARHHSLRLHPTRARRLYTLLLCALLPTFQCPCCVCPTRLADSPCKQSKGRLVYHNLRLTLKPRLCLPATCPHPRKLLPLGNQWCHRPASPSKGKLAERHPRVIRGSSAGHPRVTRGSSAGHQRVISGSEARRGRVWARRWGRPWATVAHCSRWMSA